MRLLNLELTNFGPHKNLKLDLRGVILGILGENGKGKSNLLAGLNFGITGILRDNLQSYIYNFAPGERGQKAVVVIEFQANNHHVKLRRTILPSSTNHELWVDHAEDPLTKLSDIDPQLEAILGSDKKAINVAAFIEQGQIMEMLFGDASVREKQFYRFLMVSYIPNTASIIDGKIAKLTKDIEDFTPVMDEISGNLTAAQDAREKARQERDLLPSYALEIAHLDKLRICRDRVTTALTTLTARKNDYTEVCDQVERDLSARDLSEDELDTIRKRIDIEEAEVKNLHKWVSDLIPVKEAKTEVAAWVNQKESAFTRRKNLYAELETYPDDLGEVKVVLEQNIEDQRAWKVLSQKRSALNIKRMQIRVDLTAHQKTYNPGIVDEIEKLDTKISTLNEEIYIRDIQLKMGDHLLKGHDHIDQCPVCNQSSDTPVFSVGDIERLRNKQTADRDDLRTAKSEVTALRDSVTAYESKESRLRINSTEADRELKELSESSTVDTDPGFDLDELISKRDLITDRITLMGRILNNISVENSDIERAEKGIQSMNPDMVEAIEVFDEEAFKTQSKKLEDIRGKLDKDKTRLQTIERLIQQRITSKGHVQLAETDVAKHRLTYSDLLEYDTDVSRSVNSRLKALQNDDQVCMDWYVLEDQKRKDAIAEYKQADNSVTVTMERLQQVEKKQERSQVKRQIADELRNVSKAFKSGGVASRYVAAKFWQLAELTRDSLNRLECNFMVEPDPDKPLSFLFSRTDDDTGFLMPQNKLSGGQRIRLSICFLLAIQRLIVSDLGLLILDEPSTHLDVSGVQGIRDLLLTMGESLQGSEYQVVVCDHDVILKAAMSPAIEL